MNLGENIYKHRTDKNMSQLDLADALGVSRQSVSKWETGAAVPELDKLVAMADLFGITLDQLVTGREPAPQPPEEPAPPPPAAAPAVPKVLSIREILGVCLICLGIVVLLFFMLSDFIGFGIYLALVLSTIGCACCWPFHKIIMGCMYAADVLFLFFLMASDGGMQLALIAGLPFLVTWCVLEFLRPEE